MKKRFLLLALTTMLLSCTTETLTETETDYSLYATNGDDGDTDEDPDK